MPQLTFWSWTVWLAGITAQAMLLRWAFKLRLRRAFPSIFVYLALRNITSVALLSVTLADAPWTPAVYFYAYWAAQALSCFARVWIITELGCAACVADELLCRFLRRLIPVMTIVSFFIACVLMAAEPHARPAAYVIPEVLTTVTFSRILPLTVLTAFLLFGLTQRSFGIRWTARETLFAFGLFLQMVSEFLVAWFLGAFLEVGFLSNCQGLLYLSSLALWALAFARGKQYRISVGDLARISGPFLTVGKQLRGSR